MPYLPYLYELSPLYLLQAAMTIWMLTDANKRGVDRSWFWIILAFQPFGAWAYFFIYKAKDIQGGSGIFGNLGNLFHRPPSLAELRHRVEQLPTVANQLDLGERLVETGAPAEALPYLQAVLAREPNHCQCLFLAAQCHRHLGHAQEAVPLLQTIISRNPSWSDYEAWRMLIDVNDQLGDRAAALERSRELARVAPNLQHKCLLAEHLLDTGDKGEARRIVERGLEDYRYLSGPSRRRDGRWVGKAKQLLKQID